MQADIFDEQKRRPNQYRNIGISKHIQKDCRGANNQSLLYSTGKIRQEI